MNNDLNQQEEKIQERVQGVMKYFHIAMGSLYMLLGVLFYFFPFIEGADAWVTIGISALLFVYGFIRLWRVIR